VISEHQFSALFGTVVMTAITALRAIGRSKQRGIQQGPVRVAITLPSLPRPLSSVARVYNYAMNVREVNPRLPWGTPG